MSASLETIQANTPLFAYALGVQEERDRIVELAKNRICFDHKDNCEHGACYALCDLIELIKGEQK